jgi:hypothetical protein
MKLRLVILAVLLMLPCMSWAQHPAQTIIDGSKTPEQIPDNVAYLHTLMRLSLSRNPTEAEIGARRTMLNSLKLNSTDRQVLIVIAGEFRSAHETWQARHDALAQSGGSAFNSDLLNQQHEDLITAARASIKDGLSVKGRSSLDAYIAKVKSTIKIYKGSGQ